MKRTTFLLVVLACTIASLGPKVFLSLDTITKSRRPRVNKDGGVV